VKGYLRGLLDRFDAMSKNGQLEAWATKVSGALMRGLSWLEANGPGIVNGLVDSLRTVFTWADRIAGLLGENGWGKLLGLGLATYIGGPLLVSIVSLTAAVASLGVTLGLTPIGWFIGLCALLAAAAVTIYANWDRISNFFTGMFDRALARGRAFVDMLVGIKDIALHWDFTRFNRAAMSDPDAPPAPSLAAGVVRPPAFSNRQVLAPQTAFQQAWALSQGKGGDNTLTVRFQDAPPGMRVSGDPRNTDRLRVSTSVGRGWSLQESY
jgi:CHASE2 domain-containing sensor protein